MNAEEQLKSFVRRGHYEEAKQVCETMQASDVNNVLLSLAYYDGNISSYGFAEYMFETMQDAQWSETLSLVTGYGICFYEGSYAIHLFYAHENLNLHRTLPNLSYLLTLFTNPDVSMPPEEAHALVEEVLALDPKNETALKVKREWNIYGRSPFMKQDASKEEQLSTYILTGYYYNAKQLCDTMPLLDALTFVFNLAFEQSNLSVYLFSRFMEQRTDNTAWEHLTTQILLLTLWPFPGAYAIAFARAQEQAKRHRTVGNLRHLLFYYELPEPLMSEDDAKALIRELFALDPHNHYALSRAASLGLKLLPN